MSGKIANVPEDKPAEKPKKEEDEPAPADSAVVVLTPANVEEELAKGPILTKIYAPGC